MRAVAATRPRRVVVLGVTGSGKSVLGRRVAQRRGLRVIDGDAILWLPGWRKRPAAEQAALLARAVEGDDWLLDGMRTSQAELVLGRVDLVVGLDHPRWVSLARLLRRTLRRLVTRERFANGNTEDLRETLGRDSILRWHARSFTRTRRRIRRLEADPRGPAVVRLTSRARTEAWIEGLERRGGADT